MRVYSSHSRSAGLFEPPSLVLVKEGFCWPAFLFTFLWALWHRMWLVALLLVAAEAVIAGITEVADLHPVAEIAVSLGVMLFVGFGANDWRRRSLAGRDFTEGPIVVAPDRDAAEWRLVQAGAGFA